MKAYRKIKATHPEVAALQTQVEAVLNPIARVVLLDGIQIDAIVITNAGVTIEHGLGRQPLGWFVVDKDADVNVWRTAWDQYSLTLDSSGDATLKVWIY